MEHIVPNPNLKLLNQVREVIRFKHYSIRTEQAHVRWSKEYIFFHQKRHPREMGAAEIGACLTHLAARENVVLFPAQESVFVVAEIPPDER